MAVLCQLVRLTTPAAPTAVFKPLERIRATIWPDSGRALDVTSPDLPFS